jgi:predicted ATP-grasp superfamily ATP-dependent carboligase
LRVAVFEFLCSSGLYRDDGLAGPFAPLLDEGAAMLLALSSDLEVCGHRVLVALEPSIQAAWRSCRLKSARLDRLEVHGVPTARPDSVPDIEAIATQWARIASSCDTSIVIAPELEGLLPELIESMRQKGCSVSAPDGNFLGRATDKWETHQCWISEKQITAPTWLASDWLAISDGFRAEGLRAEGLRGWGALGGELKNVHADGWVLKRRRGAGGTDMERFADSERLIGRLGTLLDLCEWIVQPWILGRSVSLALTGAWGLAQGRSLSDGKSLELDGAMGPEVIGPTEQLFGTGSMIDSASGGSYVGGNGPVEVDPQELKRFAQGLIRAVPGSKAGWIGIDFLIVPEGPWVALEINARLTSSYLGYRKHYGPMLADTILGGPLPIRPFPNPGAFRFSVRDFHG